MANQTVKVVFDGKDNTGKATKSLRGNLDNANKAIGKIKSSLGGMTGALGLAAGAAGFGLMAKKALETADNLAKTSSRLGLAAKDLGALQLAANYAGVETGTFSKLMEIFQKRVGEAAEGTGIARERLEDFGISAEKLATLPLDQQLKIIADEFKNLKTPAERAAAASDLFSNRGIKLINFLDHGSEGLEDLRDEFKALGLEIDDNALGQIESFNDSMTKFQGIVQAAMVKGLSEAAPQMEKVAEKLAKMAVPLTGKLLDGFEFLLDNLGTITKLFGAFIAVMAVTKVAQFAIALIQLGKALATVRVAAIATQAALGPIGLAMAAISTAAVFFSDDIVAATDSLDDMVGGSDDATDSTDDLEKSLNDLLDTTDDVERPLSDHADAVDEVADESAKAAVKTDDFREALEKLKEKTQAPTKAIDDFQKKVKILSDQLNKGEIEGEEFNRMLAEMTRELTGVEDELKKNTDEQEALTAAIDAAVASGGQNESQLNAMRVALEKLKDEQVDIILKTQGLTDAQIDLLDSIRGTTTEVEDYQESIRNLDQLLTAGKITQDEYNDALSDFNAEMTGIIDPVRQAEREIDSLQSQIDALGENTGAANATLQTLKSRLEAAKTAANDLAGPDGQQMIRDYYREIAKGTDPDEALDKLENRLKESETAAGQLFGVPMLNKIRGFFDAIGAGASGDGAIDLLNGSLTELEGAFAGFFASGELKFSSFVDSIIAGLQAIAAEAIVSVGLNFVKSLIPGLAEGGEVGAPGFADGGRVFGAGGPKDDKVLARLSAGEYVINAGSVSKFGTGFFDMLNAGKMELPGFEGGGFVGFDPASIAILAILDRIFGAIFASIFGGEPESRQKLSIYRGSRDYVQESYQEALKQLGENTGIGGRLYRRTTRGGYDALEQSIVPTTMRGILPAGSDLARHRNVAEGLNEMGPGFAEEIYNFLANQISDIQLSFEDFNMDQDFANMYMAASSVVNREFGGSLERGQASIVGENGPELFIPGQGGTVSPIGDKGGKELIKAVHEVRDEISDLRRQFTRIESGRALAGGRG